MRSRSLEDVVILNVDTNTLESPFDDLHNLPSDVVSGARTHARTEAHTRALTFKSFSGFIVSLLLTCRKVHFPSFTSRRTCINTQYLVLRCTLSQTPTRMLMQKKKKKKTTHTHAHTHAETCQSTALSPPNIINDCSTGSSDCGCLK